MDKSYELMMDPNEKIEFKFVPNTNVSTNIYLKNVSDLTVTYKVRTTAPKSYFVRPNQGILSPGEQNEVNIIMQGLPVYPGRVPHKFSVQYTSTTLNPSALMTDISKFWETVTKENIKSARLAVEIYDEMDSSVLPVSPPSKVHVVTEQENKPQSLELEVVTKKTDNTYVLVAGVVFVLGIIFYLTFRS